jgi:cation:H+ antiporter
MVISIVLLIIGFFLLIKGADYLVEGSSSLASKLKVSELLIGLTIVAFGTSTPELIVNIIASYQDNTGIAYGNVIGSNIVNILLILGIAGLIYPIKTEKNTVWKEIPLSLMAAVALLILCNDRILNGEPSLLSRGDGLILLLFFIIFISYSFGLSKVEIQDRPDIKIFSNRRIVVYIIVGLAALFFGGRFVVNSAVNIAHRLNISEKLIALTIVSIGTSLPELFTSAVAAKNHKSDIAIGNVVGSNIFNIFFILGISAVIRPLTYPITLNSDLIILIGASLLLFLTMFTGHKRRLDWWESFSFLILYCGYVIFLLYRR